MPTRNINLTDHYDRFVKDQIDAGRFHNASEVMRSGLRLLEQETRVEAEKLALLRSLAAAAHQQIDQGLGIEIESDKKLESFIKRIGRRAGKTVRSRRSQNG